MLVSLAFLLALTVTAEKPDPAFARGRAMFNDPGLGRNGVACAVCHAAVEDESKEGDGLLRAGHTLFGAARRPFWRGDTRRSQSRTLAAAIDICVQIFQGGGPLDPQDSRLLVAYLTALSPKAAEPVQIQAALEANLDYDRDKYRSGDPERGRGLFFRTCNACHPKGNSGTGPALYGRTPGRVAMKIREGNGLLRGAREPGGWMPFFGLDRLSDQQVADLAAYVSTLRPGG